MEDTPLNIVLEKPTAASVEVAPRRRGARLVTGLLVTCGLAVALTISPPAPWSALGAFGAADDDAWRETSPQGTVSGLGTSTCVNMTIASYGVVTIELTDSDTPVTVANFLAYVDEEFYDGTVFHRVISNFMIQGGGMDSSLNTKRNTLPAIVNEAKNGLSNTYGTISMARTSDPDSATDEFFINVATNAYLDYTNGTSAGYCAFGSVTSGYDIIEAISEVATGSDHHMSDVPSTAVVVTSVRRAKC